MTPKGKVLEIIQVPSMQPKEQLRARATQRPLKGGLYVSVSNSSEDS